MALQRIAELEAQVESLEATVQSLKEALAAAIAHAGHLQVILGALQTASIFVEHGSRSLWVCQECTYNAYT